MAGDIEREGLAFVGALVCDRGCGRAAVADLELEGLADRLAVGVGRCHGDRVIAEIAVGRHAGNDAGMGVDAETGRHRSREGQGVAGGGRLEVTGDIEREGLAFEGALVCDRGCGRAAVADLEMEGLADRHAVGVGRRDGDRVVAEIAVGRHAGDDAGMGIDLRPAGIVPEKVRVSPAAGAAKWLETSSEKAWPSKALWFAIAVAVGPLSPTWRWKVSLTAMTVGVGRCDGDRVVAEIAVGRHAGNDAGMGVDLRPAGNVPEKVRVSPAAGAAKWLETSSEKA